MAAGPAHSSHDVEWSAPVERSIVLASTPRCGSSLLSTAMRRTRKLGRPFEFCGRDALRELRARFPDQDLAGAFAELVKRRISRNGVFCNKLHFHDALAFGDFDAMRAAHPNPVFVLLTRDDQLGQALSLARAVQTHQWQAGLQGNGREAVYDADLIEGCLRFVVATASAWRFELAKRDLPWIELEHERTAADLPAAVRRVAAAAGVALDDDDSKTEAALQRQNTLGREDPWRIRFVAEAGAAWGFEIPAVPGAAPPPRRRGARVADALRRLADRISP